MFAPGRARTESRISIAWVQPLVTYTSSGDSLYGRSLLRYSAIALQFDSQKKIKRMVYEFAYSLMQRNYTGYGTED